MPTKNAIGTGMPIEAQYGGTGLSTITDHAVMIGSGTSAVTPITVGATGELLIGSTGADPAFGTSANGDFTFIGSAASTSRILTVANTDNTDIISHAINRLTVGGTAGGDPKFQCLVSGGETWSFGVDNSDNDNFLLNSGGVLGAPTTTVAKITPAGQITLPLQPVFFAYGWAGATDATNVTGDGSTYTMGDTDKGPAFISLFDVGNNFTVGASGGAYFTAPITGKYYFEAFANCSGATALASMVARILTSSAGVRLPLGAANSGKSQVLINLNGIFQMTAGDTARVVIQISDNPSALTVDLVSTANINNINQYFCGHLIC